MAKKKKSPSIKRLKYLIKDEEKAAKEYASYGFPAAKDERKHKKFLQKLLTKMLKG
jgi:hypothetical protein